MTTQDKIKLALQQAKKDAAVAQAIINRILPIR